jgi:hypothetical protein
VGRSVDWSAWAGIDNAIARDLEELNTHRKTAYSNLPESLEGEVNAVALASDGDYRFRQLYELIQNSADALTSETETGGGRIKVVLTRGALYCANEGRAFTAQGFRAIGFPNVSRKDDILAIGQFGIGFMSMSQITTSPEILSRTCCVRYSLDDAFRFFFPDLATGSRLDPAKKVHPMTYAIPVDPESHCSNDEVLCSLMMWATTVVKLPLNRSDHRDGSDFESVAEMMRSFPPEFLLFCRHVKRLEFEIRDANPVDISSWEFSNVETYDTWEVANVTGAGSIKVDRMRIPVSSSNSEKNEWLVFSDADIPLSDVLEVNDQGLARARRRDETGEFVPVTLTWAVNVNSSGRDRGSYWFYFPTQDEVTLRGIVNAPWDTNTGRTLLLDPRTNGYNKLLLTRLIRLVVTAIPVISAESAPDTCRYLDLMPARGLEESYDASKWFVPEFWAVAGRHPVIPDLDGNFRPPNEFMTWPADVALAISGANPLPGRVASEWSQLSTSREFPHISAFKNPTRKSRLDLFLQAMESTAP